MLTELNGCRYRKDEMTCNSVNYSAREGTAEQLLCGMSCEGFGFGYEVGDGVVQGRGSVHRPFHSPLSEFSLVGFVDCC